jgi:hypothetical protein
MSEDTPKAVVISHSPEETSPDTTKIIEEMTKNTQMILAKIDALIPPKKEIYIRIRDKLVAWQLGEIEELIQKVVNTKLSRYTINFIDHSDSFSNYEKLFSLLMR